jgi:integrase
VQKKIFQNKTLTKSSLTKTIQKICLEDQINYSNNSLIYFIELYIASKRNILTHSTLKRYRVFSSLIKKFEGFICKNLLLEDINSTFTDEFISFCKREEYSENTMYRSIEFVKTILNFAERKGIRTPIREIEIRKGKVHTAIITLTEQEIKSIFESKVPDELKASKDWLLISCYTGQRFSDFMNFKIDQLKNISGKICISFTQKKTKKTILLPLHPVVLDIIKRNKNNFPSIISLQRYNEDIKQIAKLAKLNQEVKAKKRIGYRTKYIKSKKWETISSHIGRRSFASNFYGKIPTPLLISATGHSNEEMFLKYINPEDDSRVLLLSTYFDKIHEEQKPSYITV